MRRRNCHILDCVLDTYPEHLKTKAKNMCDILKCSEGDEDSVKNEKEDGSEDNSVEKEGDNTDEKGSKEDGTEEDDTDDTEEEETDDTKEPIKKRKK